MKDFMTLLFFVIFCFGLASCQSSNGKDSIVSDESKDSTFTLNGAGE